MEYQKIAHPISLANIADRANKFVFKHYSRNEFDFWNVHGIFGLLVNVQETWSIHDSKNIPKIEFIAYIYIYYKYLKYENIFLI